MTHKNLIALRGVVIALLLGASGGVGAILSRWLRSLGATVIGMAGSSTKLAKVEAGATHALHVGDPDIAEKIGVIAPGGVDVLYDLIGSATFDLAAKAVRNGGTIATIGAASGHPALDRFDLARRGLNVRGGGMPFFVRGPVISIATTELWAALRQAIFADPADSPISACRGCPCPSRYGQPSI